MSIIIWRGSDMRRTLGYSGGVGAAAYVMGQVFGRAGRCPKLPESSSPEAKKLGGRRESVLDCPVYFFIKSARLNPSPGLEF